MTEDELRAAGFIHINEASIMLGTKPNTVRTRARAGAFTRAGTSRDLGSWISRADVEVERDRVMADPAEQFKRARIAETMRAKSPRIGYISVTEASTLSGRGAEWIRQEARQDRIDSIRDRRGRWYVRKREAALNFPNRRKP